MTSHLTITVVNKSGYPLLLEDSHKDAGTLGLPTEKQIDPGHNDTWGCDSSDGSDHIQGSYTWKLNYGDGSSYTTMLFDFGDPGSSQATCNQKNFGGPDSGHINWTWDIDVNQVGRPVMTWTLNGV